MAEHISLLAGQRGRWLGIAALALAYYGAARLGLLLAFEGSNASPVWPPSGIAVGILWMAGIRFWPGVFCGALIANLVVFLSNQTDPGTAIWMSTLIAGGNTLEAVLGALLLRRIAKPLELFNQLDRAYKFILVSACVCVIAAAVGTATLAMSGAVPIHLLPTVFGTWWLGDFVGILVLAPTIIAFHDLKGRNLRLGSWVTYAGILLILIWSIFGHAFPSNGGSRWLAYLLVPMICWSAFSFGSRGVSFTSLAIAAGAILSTIHGFGPFAGGTLNDGLLAIQTFVALICIIGLILCVDVTETFNRTHGAPLYRRLALHWTTLLVSLTVTVFSWHTATKTTEDRARTRIEAISLSIEARIVERMRTYEQGLRSARALFAASDEVKREEWRKFVEGMDVSRNFPGVLGIGYSKMIRAEDKGVFEAQAGKDSPKQFKVWPTTSSEWLLPVLYIEPDNKMNRRALGFDLLSEPIRAEALRTAVSSGMTTLTGRLTLLQEGNGAPRPGFLMIVPIFKDVVTDRNDVKNQRQLDAVVTSPFRMDDLMRGLLGVAENDVSLEVFDGNALDANQRLFPSSEGAVKNVVYPNPFVTVRTIKLQHRDWTMRVTSLPSFEVTVDRQKSQILLVGGAIISLLFFALVRALAAREESSATRAKTMQSALFESEYKFEKLINSAVESAIIATDLDAVIRVFSAGAERMLGYPASEVVGIHTPIQFHLLSEVQERSTSRRGKDSSDVGMLISGWHDSTDGADWTYVRKDGALVHVSAVVTPILDANGEEVGYISIAHDVSAARNLQDSLVSAKEQAEAASKAKSEFVANMSHEIRTPMNAVLGLSDLLEHTSLSVEQGKYLQMIKSSGRSLLGIIDDVLDFSKIEAGRMELSSDVFDLQSMIANCAAIMSTSAREKDIEVAIVAAVDLPRYVKGDQLRLQQVLSNLLSNAIKFTESGGVSLRVTLLRRETDRAVLEFAVTDSGIGIDEAKLAALFRPFTQADATMTRRFGGTGLGLTISKRIIELMSGSIEVDSVPGRGSCFKVRLQLELPEIDAPKDAVKLVDLQNRHVLIVDSSPDGRDSLSNCIETLGGNAHVCAGIDDAQEFLHDMPTVDMILLDHKLWKQNDANSSVLFSTGSKAPSIFITANPWGVASVTSGLTDHSLLVKPVTATTLSTALAPALRPETKVSVIDGASENRVIAGMRVLLVEDNEINQVVALGILRREGCEVEVANDGLEALAMLQANVYEVVLMDVQMPRMDGISATRRIRTDLRLDLPVIAMSAGVLRTEQEQCVSAGMNGFVAKPIEPESLVEVLSRYARPGAIGTDRKPLAVIDAQGMSPGVFDISKLLRIGPASPSRQSELRMLIGRAIEAAPLQLAQAQQACQIGDAAHALRTLHELRGMIGALGATQFVQASLILEDCIRAGGDLSATSSQTNLVEIELANSLALGRAWLKLTNS